VNILTHSSFKAEYTLSERTPNEQRVRTFGHSRSCSEVNRCFSQLRTNTSIQIHCM